MYFDWGYDDNDRVIAEDFQLDPICLNLSQSGDQIGTAFQFFCRKYYKYSEDCILDINPRTCLSLLRKKEERIVLILGHVLLDENVEISRVKAVEIYRHIWYKLQTKKSRNAAVNGIVG